MDLSDECGEGVSNDEGTEEVHNNRSWWKHDACHRRHLAQLG